MRSYIKKYNISHAQVIRGIKPLRTYVNYEDDLMLSKHLNLNSKQKIQLIQAVNGHRDKSYDIIEGLVKIRPEPEAGSGGEDDEMEEEDDDEDDEEDDDEDDEEDDDEDDEEDDDEDDEEDDDEDDEEDDDEDDEEDDDEDDEEDDDEDDDIDEDEGEDDHDEGDDHDKGNDDNEQEEQQETVKNPEGRQEKNEEETPFHASFMSRLERVSPHLPSFNRNSSFWHLGSVGPDVLFPELNEMNN